MPLLPQHLQRKAGKAEGRKQQSDCRNARCQNGITVNFNFNFKNFLPESLTIKRDNRCLARAMLHAKTVMVGDMVLGGESTGRKEAGDMATPQGTAEPNPHHQ